MKKSFFKFIHNLLLTLLLISCKSADSSHENLAQRSLSSDDGQLDLSLSTIEQQNIDKAEAEKFLLEVRRNRTVLEPSVKDELNHDSDINIALYARQTENTVGQKIYNRFKFKQKRSDPCLRFMSADDAQRFFLKNNGPKNDFWDLDPDGDGFACEWNPDQYRKIFTN